MLCPEISKFHLGRPRVFITEKSSKVPEFGPFTTRVHFVFPNLLHVPDAIKSAIGNDGEYYVARSLPISRLFTDEFIQNFILGGNLILMSTSDQFSNKLFVRDDEVMVLMDHDSLDKCGFHAKNAQMANALLSHPMWSLLDRPCPHGAGNQTCSSENRS